MEKRKVAVVTLGDSRREFYKKRESIVLSEIEKVKRLLEINMICIFHLLCLMRKMGKIFLMKLKGRGFRQLFCMYLFGQPHPWRSVLLMELLIRYCCWETYSAIHLVS